jgi:TM2 domain-containing membrane protein YozV
MINAIILYKKLKKESEKKNPGYAGFFSIVYPGTGHIYVGEYKKGILFMLIWALLIPLCFVGIGWVFAFPFGAYTAIDAFNKAREINHEEFLKLAQEYARKIEHEEHEKLMKKHS